MHFIVKINPLSNLYGKGYFICSTILKLKKHMEEKGRDIREFSKIIRKRLEERIRQEIVQKGNKNTTYQNALAHKDIISSDGKCDNMENMETYSEEVEIGKKIVRITLEFPYTADPKDTDRFEHMLKEVYINKIQKGSLQNNFQAVSFPTPEGKMQNKFACETSSQGGMIHE